MRLNSVKAPLILAKDWTQVLKHQVLRQVWQQVGLRVYNQMRWGVRA